MFGILEVVAEIRSLFRVHTMFDGGLPLNIDKSFGRCIARLAGMCSGRLIIWLNNCNRCRGKDSLIGLQLHLL